MNASVRVLKQSYFEGGTVSYVFSQVSGLSATDVLRDFQIVALVVMQLSWYGANVVKTRITSILAAMLADLSGIGINSAYLVRLYVVVRHYASKSKGH